MNYWIIVASKDHVQKGVKGGFCQAGHGKKWPLQKMSTGDGVLFYSSKEKLGDTAPFQKFTAFGFVEDDEIYQVTVNADFKPFRRNVDFKTGTEVEIHPLLEKLHFVDDVKKWGYKLRFGFLEIDQHDFELITSQMK